MHRTAPARRPLVNLLVDEGRYWWRRTRASSASRSNGGSGPDRDRDVEERAGRGGGRRVVVGDRERPAVADGEERAVGRPGERQVHAEVRRPISTPSATSATSSRRRRRCRRRRAPARPAGTGAATACAPSLPAMHQRSSPSARYHAQPEIQSPCSHSTAWSAVRPASGERRDHAEAAGDVRPGDLVHLVAGAQVGSSFGTRSTARACA